MEVLGFVFGITGMSFGLIGMTTANAAMGKIRDLEKRVADAPATEAEADR